MSIFIKQENFSAEGLPVIAIIANEAEPEQTALDPLRGEMRDFCRRVIVNQGFRAEAGSKAVIPVADKTVKYVVIAGAGPADKETEDTLRQAAFTAARTAAELGCDEFSITMPRPEDGVRARAAAEGAALAASRFNKYKSADKKDKFAAPKKIAVPGAAEAALLEGEAAAEAQMLARSLANEPGCVITPETLAERAAAIASDLGMKCEIWNEERIARENMGAYYAVAKGSKNPPRFIVLTYEPQDTPRGHIALVGKGITFDSGGLDIKPAEFMLTMKGDKSGACAVIAAAAAAAKLKLPYKVTAIVAAAENMPDGGAYRPDDILRARNGKTIEVNNTDAEGRLTLADALVYASELKPDAVVDIATLTGACAVALGTTTAGLFTNDDGLGEKILKAAKGSGERFWKLPMDDPNLRKLVKSPFADVVNSAGRYGGAITAAMFLEEFVAEGTPWAHLDIAACDFVKKPYSYYAEGASGFGARTLIRFIQEF